MRDREFSLYSIFDFKGKQAIRVGTRTGAAHKCQAHKIGDKLSGLSFAPFSPLFIGLHLYCAMSGRPFDESGGRIAQTI